jgi:hypothetical protein
MAGTKQMIYLQEHTLLQWYDERVHGQHLYKLSHPRAHGPTAASTAKVRSEQTRLGVQDGCSIDNEPPSAPPRL